MTRANRPSFEKPPVVERVLGVQFDPLPKFTNAHLGSFWKTLGDEWPDVQDAPPLPQEIERFGDERVWAQIGLMQLRLSGLPEARVQIRNQFKDRMIQLQNGRLHYNWLRLTNTEYARFEAVKPEFDELVKRFNGFLADHRLGCMKPNQWEITYVNHLPQGTVWNTVDDWNKVFVTPVALPLTLPGVGLESFAAQWHYEIAPKRGRLHVELQHGREELNELPAREILLFKLTARGLINEQQNWTLEEGIKLGHDAIVDGFARLTSSAARRFWEEQPCQ